MGTEEPKRSAADMLREEAARDRAARDSAEAQLRRLLDVSLIGVCTCDLDGRVLEANDAFLRILGSTREELRALSLDLIERTPERLRDLARRMRTLVVEQGEIAPAEIELVRSDGQTAPVLVSGGRLPNRNAVVLFAQDLSEPRRKEAAARAVESRLSLLLESAPVMLFELDAWGVFSLSRQPLHPSLIGTAQALLVRWPLQPELIALGRRALSGEEARARVELPEHTLDIVLRPERSQLQRLPEAHAPAVLGVALDCTREARARKEQERLHAWLMQEHKLDSVGILGTGLAHAFNNLLAGMLTNASAARTSLGDGHPLAGALDDILSAANRASALARQLLLTAVPPPGESRSLDLSQQIRAMAPLLTAALPPGCRLELRLSEALPLVRTHPDQLRRALVPLVIGAIEATASRGELIRVSTNLCQIDSSSRALVGGDQLEAGWYVRLEVSDDGDGLDARTLEELIDPAADPLGGPAHRGKPQARALGLAAVLGSMRGQRGSVRVGIGDNSRGTRIELLYPVGSELPEPRRLRTKETPLLSREVLVVDDDPIVRRAVVRVLRHMSLQASEAASGEEALKILSSGDPKPGLVFLDFAMPGMNGEQTLRAIKELHPGVRFLMSSGYSESEATWRLEANELSGFIGKPFIAEELQAAITRALEGAALLVHASSG